MVKKGKTRFLLNSLCFWAETQFSHKTDFYAYVRFFGCCTIYIFDNDRSQLHPLVV